MLWVTNPMWIDFCQESLEEDYIDEEEDCIEEEGDEVYSYSYSLEEEDMLDLEAWEEFGLGESPW